MKQQQTKMERVETILRYYRLKGVNKEKINDLKHKLLKNDKV